MKYITSLVWNSTCVCTSPLGVFAFVLEDGTEICVLSKSSGMGLLNSRFDNQRRIRACVGFLYNHKMKGNTLVWCIERYPVWIQLHRGLEFIGNR